MVLHSINLASITATNLRQVIAALNDRDAVVLLHGEMMDDDKTKNVLTTLTIKNIDIYWQGQKVDECLPNAKPIGVAEWVQLTTEFPNNCSWF